MAISSYDTADRIRRFFTDFETSDRDWDVPNPKKFNDFCLFALAESKVDTDSVTRVQIGQSGNEELTPTVNMMCAVKKCFNLNDLGLLDFLSPNPKRTIAIINRILDYLEFADAEVGNLLEQNEQLVQCKKDLGNLKSQIDFNNQRTNSIYLTLSKMEDKITSCEEELTELVKAVQDLQLEETNLQNQVLLVSTERDALTKVHLSLKTRLEQVEEELTSLREVGDHDYQGELARAEAERDAYLAERQALWDKVYEKSGRLPALEARGEALSALLRLVSATNDYSEALREVTNEFEKSHAKHNSLMSKIKELEESCSTEKSSMDKKSWEEGIKRTKQELDDTADKLKYVTRAVDEMKTEAANLKYEKYKLENTLEELRSELKAIITEHKSENDENVSDEEQVHQMVQELLGEHEESLDRLNAQLREANTYFESRNL